MTKIASELEQISLFHNFLLSASASTKAQHLHRKKEPHSAQGRYRLRKCRARDVSEFDAEHHIFRFITFVPPPPHPFVLETVVCNRFSDRAEIALEDFFFELI